MSGITGIIRFDGASAQSAQVEKMTAFMASLGPDGQSHWARDSVALGHCMLRTTPESIEEHQPLFSQDNKLVLVWDGRLDNRSQLHGQLKSAGIILRDHSDAELVLQSYENWGEDCPRYLLGDFAFAVWDARSKQLFCVSDHMGARPFYYTCNDSFLAFASEEEALLEIPGVSNQPREASIFSVLGGDFPNPEPDRSWLESVRILLPASMMRISLDGTVQSEAYWQFEAGEESVFASDEECQEAFLEVFGEAIRCRMRSAGHVSAMMSGGLDSAGIAAMVQKLMPEMPGKEFHSYSAISDDPENCIESQCILSLSSSPGFRAHFLAVPSFSGMLDVHDLLEVGWSRAHPVDNSILLPAMMFLAASRDGHRVMLHGMGGDFTMRIPTVYIAYLMQDRQWREAWNECRTAGRNNIFLQGQSSFQLLARSVWTAYAWQWAKRARQRLRNAQTGPSLTDSLINSEWARTLQPEKRAQAKNMKTALSLPAIQQSHIDSMQPPYGYVLGLNGYNRAAARCGIELRDPWSDRRVAEFFLRLPLKYKVRQGWTKYLVRTAFTEELQPLVRWRLGKEHLGWNFATRLMNESDDMVSRVLGSDFELLDKYLDRKVMRDWYSKRNAGRDDWQLQSIYEATTLGLWLKRISC